MPHVTVHDVVAALVTGAAQLIDVRESYEYDTGHVAGAASIPMGQLVGRLAEIDRGQPVLVICQSGGRSSAMADVLRHHGYDAHSVVGGTAAWMSSGRPVATGVMAGM